MIIRKYDQENSFVSIFDTESGRYIRTGILKDGKDTDEDPFMTSFPELLDVGIMGHCAHGREGLCSLAGIQCYQSGMTKSEPNMSFDDFKKIADECKGKTFQFALGGRGDPDQHENFIDILKYCRECNIVPNFTSSGMGFNNQIVEACAEYCGAVAISWYRQPHTWRAINMLIEHGVKTNIHYVLNTDTIDEAIRRLDWGDRADFPEGINAIIFLLHKPVGQGQESKMLKYDDPRVKRFFELIDDKKYDFKIGFDSCSVPGLINFTEGIDPDSYDTCEGGRWSAYITSDMKMLPCSFDNQEQRWAYDIRNDTIQNAWNSPQFENFRDHFRNSCSKCDHRLSCRGGCPIRPQIVLCNREEKDLYAKKIKK